MRRLRLSRLLTFALAAAFLAVLLGGTFHPWPVSAQQASPTPNLLAAVAAPQAGQTVIGQVSITGSAAPATGFAAYEVSFAYAGDTSGTWFPIQRGETPVTEGVLSVWDTTAITDGLYDLRLRVVLTSGDVLEDIVRNIDVRNYTPTQSPTLTPSPPPTLTPVPVIPTATSTPTRTPPPTPTALPPNPAAVDSPALVRMLITGALAALGVFVLFGLFRTLSSK